MSNCFNWTNWKDYLISQSRGKILQHNAGSLWCPKLVSVNPARIQIYEICSFLHDFYAMTLDVTLEMTNVAFTLGQSLSETRQSWECWDVTKCRPSLVVYKHNLQIWSKFFVVFRDYVIQIHVRKNSWSLGSSHEEYKYRAKRV